MSGSGAKGTAMYQLLSLGFRLVIVLLVVAVGGWIYLIKRVERAPYIEGIRASIESGLSAKKSELRGFSYVQGQLGISRLACDGGEGTFFNYLEARNIHCSMGLLDGLAGTWDTGPVAISRLNIDLRAGSDDSLSAQKIQESVFRKHPKLDLTTIEVADTTIRWGYSERTRGAIEGSLMRLARIDDKNLKIYFRGGTFSQNWLRKLEIVEIELSCNPEGIVFEKASLRRGLGTVEFLGLNVTGGERPQISGTAKIRKVALDSLLPIVARTVVEGSLSGDFQITGSTNTPDGVGFAGSVTLDGSDNVISLRERIHLFKALSVVDYSRNYHRVDFREGSFKVKTSGGGLELSEVDLKAADSLLTLEGKMQVRLPTPEETMASANAAVGESSPIFLSEAGGATPFDGKVADDFSLRRSALEAKRLKEGKQAAGSVSVFDKLNTSLEMHRLDEEVAELASRTLRYEGLFKITIPADAFERTPKLTEQYPVDPKLGRVPVNVPVQGTLYEITLKQANEIYQKGKR